MNNTGKKFGGRKAGTPNKLTAEVKEKIKQLLDGAIDSIDLNECFCYTWVNSKVCGSSIKRLPSAFKTIYPSFFRCLFILFQKFSSVL